MKRYIRSSEYNHQSYNNQPRPSHLYKGHKIIKIYTCGQWMYKVKDMPDDFYDRSWGGEFETLREAKKYIDAYELRRDQQ